MTRTSYILFAFVIIGLAASLLLYYQSKGNSERFIQRVNTVNHVLFLLERTDKLKNILRKTVFEGADHKDTAAAYIFSTAHKAEVDSILQLLHTIVLYEDQRLRIDTLRALIDHNYALLTQGDPRNAVSEYQGVASVIIRARTYAEKRLNEHQQRFEVSETNVGRWANAILLLSAIIFSLGVWSILYENLSKQRLKNLHEAILENATMGISVFEVRNGSSPPKPKLVFSNFGAVAHQPGDGEFVINLNDRVDTEPGLQERMRLALATGKSHVSEIRHQFHDHTYWFLAMVSRVSTHTIAFYYYDITSIKAYEQHLRSKLAELESVNKDLEQFAHATSHDLREPFRKIQVMSDMILKNYNPKNQQKYLEAILRASDKGARLVEQILNYSKIQFDKSALERVDLNQVVTQVIDDLDLLMMEKDAMVEFRTLPEVFANRVQMVQVFSNIISNALKFSAEQRKPIITISSSETTGQRIEELSADEQYYRIEIRDNGIGFDPKQRTQIFNAFHRLNNYEVFPGFGLGLSLCKKIVQNHGGAIRAASTPGEGSQFIIYLPKE